MAQADHRAERLRRQAERQLADQGDLPAWKRQVLARFLVESPRGWCTYLRETGRGAGPDALVIGPKGVLAVLLREQPPPSAEANGAFRRADDLFVGARARSGGVAETVVRPVVVFPPRGAEGRAAAGDYLAVAADELERVLERGERRLDRRDVGALAQHLEGRDAGYEPRSLPQPRESTEDGGAADGELFSADDVERDRFDAALAGPFEAWLTFLDDSQLAMTRRRYNGPARISGPAGTGKSVVALHRMVRLARRSTGPLLFTTYARTLPPIAKRGFLRLAPELAERVAFCTLHKWASAFLRERGVDVPVDHGGTQTSFALAWSRFGRQSKLAELNSDWSYWWDEVDRVIKGRGLRDVAEYQRVPRTGRGMRLERGHDREQMWQLYELYEEIRRSKGQHDFNDLLAEALREVQREPPDPPYAAVIVDEVQDITLIGLRLLRAIAGDGPDGLLLVGDGQQQIYAGGWRLSDAGIPVRGRGEVLRENYRNASRILDKAKEFDATNQVDDLDGDVGFSLREAVATLRGGQVVPWRGPRAEHAEALVAALRELSDVAADDIAVLTFDRKAARSWRGVLREAGFATTDLDDYAGERDDTVKVGTVHRAKGLEFQAVLVPELPSRGDGHERGREWLERGQRARLVALTRARDHLWLGEPGD